METIVSQDFQSLEEGQKYPFQLDVSIAHGDLVIW